MIDCLCCTCTLPSTCKAMIIKGSPCGLHVSEYGLNACACRCRKTQLNWAMPKPNSHTKKYCSLINFGLHHYQPTQWLVTQSTFSPSTYVHICTLFVSYAVFIYYFNSISIAIRLSGCKVAIKLIDWCLFCLTTGFSVCFCAFHWACFVVLCILCFWRSFLLIM